MQGKRIIKNFKITKIVQLSLLLIIEVIFFFILFQNPSLSKNLYTNTTLLTLFLMVWILMIFNLVCLFLDFFKLRSFAEESHALHKAAYLDHLTGIPNRHGLDVVFQTYDTPESLREVGCFMVTIDNLKDINENLGHQTGDMVIQHFCSIFEDVGDRFGVVGRNSGNEFVMVMNNCSHDSMAGFIQALNEHVTAYNREYTNAPLHIRYSYVLNSEIQVEAFTLLLTATYNKLHS